MQGMLDETDPLTTPEVVYNILRVRVCAAHMSGFLGRNSINKGTFFSRFSINVGGLSRNWRKIAKNRPFSTKVHHKGGYVSKFR